MLLDATSYELFARMLQDNVCLCCGEQFVGYHVQELLEMLLKYMREHPEFHKQIRAFQLAERHQFMDAEERIAKGEHRLEWTEAHRRFVDLIDGHLQAFVKQSGCLDCELISALAKSMNNDSANWPPFAKVLSVTDYEVFSKMLQDNVCLCCGETFCGYLPGELAEKITEYVCSHPELHEEVRNFQMRERELFLSIPVNPGEHRLEWSDVHTRFMQLVEVHVDKFMNEVHCSEEEFMTALKACRDAESRPLSLFAWLLTTSDYQEFATMLQANLCLCCGQRFQLV